MHGFPREGIFYSSELSQDFVSYLPKIYHSSGVSNQTISTTSMIKMLLQDMSTGDVIIIQQDLSDWVQSGYFFGPGSPLNWGKDLQALTAGCASGVVEISRRAFLIAADFHSLNWGKKSLLDLPWLQGRDWLRGEGRQKWEAVQVFLPYLCPIG